MGVSKLFRLRHDATLEDVIRQVMTRIVELEPGFPPDRVEPDARRKVAEWQADDPGSSMAALWTRAEGWLRNWHLAMRDRRAAAEDAEKQKQQSEGVPGLIEVNRSFLNFDETAPGIPRWW
jgi:hypothetical protein